ncbi:DUF1223 domain-containing protein [Spirosoma panaciterrae]|uniref:DUF1223 domain-containing protein n=1 Tax=Spirosoma panaciterrae TaxID=496058 RepID=UPI00035C6A2B|nr:DUF1223 domain-containing protein [Spirosoma panaciterrae]
MIHLLIFFISLVGGFSTDTLTKPAPQPIVVLELFTSQGCSSCPPADKLLQEITQQATQSGQAVYGLSFHVDYWNRLGWNDQFSAKAYTDRQRQYDRLLKSQTYTPQLVINGSQDVIGGQRGRIEQAIQAIQKQPASSFVNVEASLKKQAGQVTVSYNLSNTGPYRVNVALVQKEARTAVKNGENGGRTLVNTNVVRQFKTLDNPAQSGTTTLTIPSDLPTDQAAVLVYIQRTDTQQIVGAKRL